MYMSQILYYWVGFDRRSRKRQGLVWAESPEHVRQRMQKIMLIPVSVGASWMMFLSPVWWRMQLQQFEHAHQLSCKQLSLFFHSLHTLLAGKMLPYQALQVLSGTTIDPTLRLAVLRVVAGIQKGLSLGDAFKSGDAWWPAPVIVAMAATQQSGTLDEVSVYLAEIYTLQRQLYADMVTVLFVPALTCFAAVGMLGWVAQFCVSYVGSGDRDAALTGIYWFLHVMLDYGIFFVIGVIFVGGLMLKKMKVPTPEKSMVLKILSRFALLMPVITGGHSLFFFKITAVLMRSGVSLIAAFSAVRAVHPNLHWRGVIQSMEEGLRAGYSLPDVLSAAPPYCIPSAVLHMIVTAQNSDQVATVFNTTAELLRHERAQRLKRLLSLLQPALLIGLGVFVAYFLSIAYKAFSQSIDAMNFV
jgi:type II secretory pathway component PulF